MTSNPVDVLTSAYRCLTHDDFSAAPIAAPNFIAVMQAFATLKSHSTKPNLAAAIKSIKVLSTSLPKSDQIRFLDVRLSPSAHSIQQSGIDLVASFDGCDRDANLMTNAVRKTHEIFKQIALPPEEIVPTILEGIKSQQTMLKRHDECIGFCALSEMAHRPHLLSDPTDPIVAILDRVSCQLTNLTRCFSQRASVSPKESQFLVEQMANHIKKYKYILLSLCRADSSANRLIHTLIHLADDPRSIPEWTAAMKESFSGICQSPLLEITQAQIQQFFEERGKQLSEALPLQFQPDYAGIGSNFAQTFPGYEPQYRAPDITFRESEEDLWEDSHITPSALISENPFNPSPQLSNEMREKLLEFGKASAEDFYISHKLITKRALVIENGKTLIMSEIIDPNESADVTIFNMILYQLEKQGKNYPLGLDERQKMGLIPEIVKNIVIFGSMNNAFDISQLFFALDRYNLREVEEIREILFSKITQADLNLETRIDTIVDGIRTNIFTPAQLDDLLNKYNLSKNPIIKHTFQQWANNIYDLEKPDADLWIQIGISHNLFDGLELMYLLKEFDLYRSNPQIMKEPIIKVAFQKIVDEMQNESFDTREGTFWMRIGRHYNLFETSQLSPLLVRFGLPEDRNIPHAPSMTRREKGTAHSLPQQQKQDGKSND